MNWKHLLIVAVVVAADGLLASVSLQLFVSWNLWFGICIGTCWAVRWEKRRLFQQEARSVSDIRGVDRFRHVPAPRLEEISQCRTGTERGGTLLEMVVIVAIVLVVSATAMIDVSSTLRLAPVDTAGQLVVQQMRSARQSAITDRTVYRLTFNLSGMIVLDQLVTVTTTSGSTTTTTTTVNNISNTPIPTSVSFHCEPSLPVDPDGFGDGTVPITFNGYTQIFFQPDGSGRDTTGKTANGVVYLAVRGVIGSSRSVTLWGSTGQIHLYKLYGRGSGWYWK